MESSRPVARWVGALLFVQLAGLIVPFALLHPMMPPGFLDNAAASTAQVKVAVGLLFLNCVLTIAISAILWPVLRHSSEEAAVLLVAGSVIMFSLQAVDNAHLLSMLSLSQQYVNDSGHGELLQAMGATLRSTRRWVHYSELFSIEVWIGLLYAALLRFTLVPRVLAIAGLATVMCHFGGIVVPFYLGYSSVMPLGMPMGLSHLALAGWLVTKGFRGTPAT
jgi:hypothetical protein